MKSFLDFNGIHMNHMWKIMTPNKLIVNKQATKI